MKVDLKAHREIIRFLIAGTIVGAIDFGSYYVFIRFLSFSIAKGFSFACAGIVSYLFNKYWIFQYNRLSSYPEMRRYVIITLAALALNIFVNQSMLNVMPGGVLLALIVAAMSTGVFTFIFFKWWVFKAQATPATASTPGPVAVRVL